MATDTDLYVDLDGTFIKSDMLLESFIVAVKANPLIIFSSFLWLLKGRAYLKSQLAKVCDLQIDTLPLNEQFYEFLKKQRADGRKIILATASNEKFAASIMKEYEIFDSFISSNSQVNLKGEEKLKAIQKLGHKFSYAGNSSEDFVLFKNSVESYLVNPTPKALRMSKDFKVTSTFDATNPSLLVWVKQLRLHQWIKNLLLFVPLIVSGLFFSVDSIIASILGFISFGCLASATYILNDLLDLQSDRSHPRKRNRPLAAGKISILHGVLGAIILFIVAFFIAAITHGPFVYLLLVYLALTLSYSFSLKEYIGIDVIVLASLYTLRIIGGTILLDVTISFWLLSFSMFIFLSLALVKRCAELKGLMNSSKERVKGRDYHIDDYSVLMNIGTSCAMLAVLMFCFYVNSNVLADQYQQPTLLWLILPALSYWIMRMWIKTNRGEMHDDPIVFSIKDRGSVITVAAMGVLALMAQIL